MNKKKNRASKKRAQPQKSFAELVADQTQAKIDSAVNNAVARLANGLVNIQRQHIEGLFTRIVVLEELLVEKLEGVDQDLLADRVANLEDKQAGLEAVEEVAEGDRVRATLRTKLIGAKEFNGESRQMIDNVGLGNTLGPDIEKAMLGMKVNETKLVKLEEAKSEVEILINRISRSKVDPQKVKEEFEAAEVGV